MWHSPVFEGLKQQIQEEALIKSEQLQTYMKNKNLEAAQKEEENKYKALYEQSKKENNNKGEENEGSIPTPVFTENY